MSISFTKLLLKQNSHKTIALKSFTDKLLHTTDCIKNIFRAESDSKLFSVRKGIPFYVYSIIVNKQCSQKCSRQGC
jgi:hypothetical protein